MASVLQFLQTMRINKIIKTLAYVVVCAFAVSMASTPTTLLAAGPLTRQAVTAARKLSPNDKRVVDTFNRHVKDYLKQRDRVRKKLIPLSKEAKPEEIEAYQKSFVEGLRAMRAGTKQGYIFMPDFAEYVRTIIKVEFPARDKAEMKETILDADTKGVPLKVNYPYPETKEMAQTPATLLLKLPQLPKELKYRFVGRHMLLVDTDNNLIVDYMLNALP